MWETVDDDEVDKAQTAHTFDLSTLLIFVPRNDDEISLTSFATGTSKLTMNIGSFQDPIFQENEEVVVEDDDTDMLQGFQPPPLEQPPV